MAAPAQRAVEHAFRILEESNDLGEQNGRVVARLGRWTFYRH